MHRIASRSARPRVPFFWDLAGIGISWQLERTLHATQFADVDTAPKFSPLTTTDLISMTTTAQPPGPASTSQLHDNSASTISLEHVTKRFRQGESTVEALRDISLTIGAGEFVAVMGASGSGKSTLLHVLAGLTRPDRGKVTVDGVDLASLSDARLTHFRRRHIGLVFQAFNLLPSLTARENIELPLLTDGRRDLVGQRLEPLMQRLGLKARSQHRPDALSGGEQQRVAIARALITNPALILADEPTGSLDSVTGQEICRLLRELCNESRRSIAVVTHEPAVAVWASRVIVMRDGCILSEFSTAPFDSTLALAAHYQQLVNIDPARDIPSRASM